MSYTGGGGGGEDWNGEEDEGGCEDGEDGRNGRVGVKKQTTQWSQE